MALYDYRCPRGHLIEAFFRISDRPETIRCEAHGEDCLRDTTPHAVAANGVAQVVTSEEWSPEERARRTAPVDYAMRAYRCPDCRETQVEVAARALGETLPETMACACGGVAVEAPLFIETDDTNRYPYFDEGLDLLIESASHRRRVCRERGLTPVEQKCDLAHYARDDKDREFDRLADAYEESTLKRLRNDTTGPYAQAAAAYREKYGPHVFDR